MTPSPDAVRAQLARIVASQGFASADRMSAFLTYVVERALAGEETQVKEYSVGVDVFGRAAGYDPRVDSIVRVEARRLRTKLDEYYAGDGAADPVVIRMPRGGYVPTFEAAASRPSQPAAVQPPALLHAPTAATSSAPAPSLRRPTRTTAVALVLLAVIAVAAAAWRTNGRSQTITVAVLPFEQYATDEANRLLAERLTDGVTRELARTGRVGVVSHTSAVNLARGGQRASDIGRALGADILVEASVERRGDDLLIWVRLVRAGTDRKMWVQDFTSPPGDTSKVERQIAEAIVPAVLAPPSQ